MASRPKKSELIEKCAELGIDVPSKATVAELSALIEEAERSAAPGWPREMTVKCDGFLGINLRVGPSKNAPSKGVLDHRSKVMVESIDGEWAKARGGYCMAKFLV